MHNLYRWSNDDGSNDKSGGVGSNNERSKSQWNGSNTRVTNTRMCYEMWMSELNKNVSGTHRP